MKPDEAKRYETADGEDAVEVRWWGEEVEYTTYTRGTADPLYRGPSIGEAQRSLVMDDDEWDELTRGDGIDLDDDGNEII